MKVLDFGIAKLGEIGTPAAGPQAPPASPSSAQSGGARGFSAAASSALAAVAKKAPGDLEGDTLLYDSSGADGALIKNAETSIPAPVETSITDTNDTKLFALPPESEPLATPGPAAARHTAPPAQSFSADLADDHTLKFDQLTRPVPLGARTTLAADTAHGTELTRIGAITGTPMYMSPEQCSGKNIDSRSDTYSLGVIAYQMLAGEPPFAGDTSTILRGHIETPPPPLREQNKKVPNRVAQLVMSALAKDPAGRPASAAAFASALRALRESRVAVSPGVFAL